MSSALKKQLTEEEEKLQEFNKGIEAGKMAPDNDAFSPAEAASGTDSLAFIPAITSDGRVVSTLQENPGQEQDPEHPVYHDVPASELKSPTYFKLKKEIEQKFGGD